MKRFLCFTMLTLAATSLTACSKIQNIIPAVGPIKPPKQELGKIEYQASEIANSARFVDNTNKFEFLVDFAGRSEDETLYSVRVFSQVSIIDYEESEDFMFRKFDRSGITFTPKHKFDFMVDFFNVTITEDALRDIKSETKEFKLTESEFDIEKLDYQYHIVDGKGTESLDFKFSFKIPEVKADLTYGITKNSTFDWSNEYKPSKTNIKSTENYDIVGSIERMNCTFQHTRESNKTVLVSI